MHLIIPFIKHTHVNASYNYFLSFFLLRAENKTEPTTAIATPAVAIPPIRAAF